ncbi:MAG TPA: MFS transporter [Streptosporangiaceae bacterium]|nr:MFS transporter [Streptosporangiaceae bacterium]
MTASSALIRLPVVRVVARHPFVRIAFARDARRLAAGGLVGRFREAGTGLAIVLAVHGSAGSYAVAGTAGAAYLLAAAVSRPAHGRLVDKTGGRRGLLGASLANSLALAGLAVAVWVHGRDGLLLAASAAIGLTLPALSAALRALWPQVIAGPQDEAYAFDTLLYETSLIISPACVGLIATLASAPAALIVLACAGTLGTAIVATAPAARTARAVTAGPAAERLLSRLVITVITVTLFSGFAEGSMTVIVPAFASHHHQAAAAGPLLAALACGCLAGSLGYGLLARRGRWPGRLVTCACALTLTCAGLAGLSHGIIVFGVLLAATGVTLAPTLTTGFVAIQQTAPPASLAEAFTWASFCASAGAASAQALAGNLIAHLGVTIALWLPAAAAAATAGTAILTRRLYRAPR